MNKDKQEPINLQRAFNHTSPSDIENIMEYFEDMNYLSERGKAIRHAFWKLFIYKKD